MRKIPQPTFGERTTVHLEIPLQQAGLMRQVLAMAFREARQCSDPRLFDGTGALQLAISRLHRSIDRQLGQVEGKTQ